MHLSEALYQAALAELKVRGPALQSTWRHRSGGLYVVVAHCVLEADLTPAVGYVAADAGAGAALWVRPLAEFTDGRFTPET
jgi:hypothetical protein